MGLVCLEVDGPDPACVADVPSGANGSWNANGRLGGVERGTGDSC